MKPSDHPDFYRRPPPDGRSRESTIRLDASGRFWHDGAPVEHPGLIGAFRRWICRHPDDRRYILTNGYDWTYFTVDDAPFAVEHLRIEVDRIVIGLNDGTEEAWDPRGSRIGPGGALYAVVKRNVSGGPYEARFTRHAQTSLAPALVETGHLAAQWAPGDWPTGEQAAGEGGVAVRVGDRIFVIDCESNGRQKSVL